MTSKIINMADRMKDNDDLKLEALFASERIADDGFSDRVVSRIRRRLWVRRWTLPIAVLVGGLIAAKPASEVLLAMGRIVTALPDDLRSVPLDSLPSATIFVLGGSIVGIMALLIGLLED